ncbi:NPH3 domain [Arabidopsis suecica]|uniref:NPH3 domain n=1 Tax=Arabidopsis suecica TaxID=45249 RepID=A0A8T1YHH1_ARASU|nr:NPH3 domain [Arabidopsis suecica]
MDVRKLTNEASMHAAQNERLPLRVVVQVLYFEQLRANHSPVASVAASSHSPVEQTEENKGEGATKKVELSKKSRGSKSTRSGGGAQLMPSRSRRIFEKIWPGKGESSNKSSEVSSGSAQSPPAKSSSSSSRRCSIRYEKVQRHCCSVRPMLSRGLMGHAKQAFRITAN